MPVSSLLSLAHAALINAIKTSPHTTGKFRRVFDHLDKPGRLQSWSIGDLPAIEVLPVRASSRWVENTSQQLTYTIRFSIYTPEWSTVQGELLYMQTVAALTQSFDTPSDPGSVWRLLPASSEVSITLEQINDGPTVTVWSWEQPLMVGRWNPKTVTP